MVYPMVKMVVINGIRYKPEDAARLGHKAVSPNMPIGVEPTEVVEINEDGVVDGTEAEDGDDDEATEVVQPSKGGSKADWVAYAVAQGAEIEDVADMSRDEIAETYGE